MSEMMGSRNHSRAAEISSIIRFWDVLEPFEITSNMLLLSFNSWTGTVLCITIDNYCESAIAMSNISLNAITSPDIAERVTRLDLYDLKDIATTESVASPRETTCTSWDESSWL